MRVIVVALLDIALALAAFPCTTFCLRDGGHLIYGRNYDFETGVGYVMTNRRGVAKTSLAGTLWWTSRYGSVTLNQWGREFPSDGMNDAGLVAAQLWLDGTTYPVDERPVLGAAEWMQYQLDNFGTVEEVLSRAEEVRINRVPLHYLFADATGDVATIEYLAGRLVVHRGVSLRVPVLTNTTYAESVDYLGQFRGFGGSRSMPGGSSSKDRFVRAAMLAASTPPSVDAAFGILGSVAQAFTRWSVVYDIDRREVAWISDRSAARKTIRVSALPLDCVAEGKMLDIHSTLEDDVTELLEPYSAARNRQLVLDAYAQTSFTRDDPIRYAEADAAHAESFWCAQRRRAVAH